MVHRSLRKELAQKRNDFYRCTSMYESLFLSKYTQTSIAMLEHLKKATLTLFTNLPLVEFELRDQRRKLTLGDVKAKI